MSEMRRAALSIATLAAVVLVAAGPRGSARASASTRQGGAPLTTGRALIGVRTPRLPPLDSRNASERRRQALGESRDLLDTVARRDGITVDARSVPGGFIATDLAGRSVAQLSARLADDPLVTRVVPEYRAEYRYAPSDPGLYASDPNAPAQDRAQWNVLDTGAETAWNLAKGRGAEVAVIDSGVDVSHPDLAPRISGTLNTCTTPPLLGGCEGTGVTDNDGHGTHVSGLACATADNHYGIASIGFGCSIYAIKSDLTYTSIVNSIYAAVAHGSDAINMSFGGGGDDPNLRSALSYAWSNGLVAVAAGDNTPMPSPDSNYPAEAIQPDGSGPNIDAGKGLVVTSASHSGLRSAFAQKTSGVSVAAYGSATDEGSGGQQGILSTWPANSTTADLGSGGEWLGNPCGCRTSVAGENRFAYLSGTSMAAPQVAGLVALMRSGRPNLGAAKLVRLIKVSASNCVSYSNGIGWGVIRASDAVGAAVGRDVDPPRSRVVRARRIARQMVSVRIKGHDRACSKELPVTGLKSVAVFASANHGRYHRIGKTATGKLHFRGKPGRRYRFFSIAVDKAGNREAPPGLPDAKLRLRHRHRR
jgi:serine protease